MKKGKFCTNCERWKELTEFHRDKYTRDGYTYHCKQCRNDYHQDYRVKTNYEKDREWKHEVRSSESYRKMEYKKHTEYTRKNSKKFADYMKKRRLEETPEEKKIRLDKMRVKGRKYKYKAKIEKILTL